MAKKKNIKNLFFVALMTIALCGIFFGQRAGNFQKKIKVSIPILMYHNIRDYYNQNDKIGTTNSVSPEKFSEELDLIKKKGYETITFEDLEKNNIPKKPIILTFDDGNSNFYESAFPELKKRNMKAVVFIITGRIGKIGYLDDDKIKKISFYGIEIGSHTVSHRNLSKLFLTNSKKRYPIAKR